MSNIRKSVVIQLKPRKSRIAQEFSEGLEFALVSKDNKQINQFVFCKDFIQDAIEGFLNNHRVSIYGFIYDPTKPETLLLCLEKTRLLLTNWRDKQFRFKLDNCIDFVNQFEDRLGMSRTEVMEVENAPPFYKKAGIWLFEGCKRWMQAPPMISLYTLLLRVGFSHKVGQSFEKTMKDIIAEELPTEQYSDQIYLQDAEDGIRCILEHGDQKIFGKEMKKNYPNIGTYDMHSECGIVGFSRGFAADFCPHWYEKIELGGL